MGDAPAGGSETAARPNLRVLLVEDDAVSREVATLMLERLGCDVDAVADGAAAVTAAAARSYSAILMDCRMPLMDGYEATVVIRADEAPEARVPIIGLSTFSDRQRCLDAGMDDYLPKPFASDALARALDRAAPAAAGASARTGVLDPGTVEQLRALALAGNSGLLHKLHASFARDTPVRLRALRAAVAAGDPDAVAFHAHTLKGSAANLGAIAVVATCEQIEGAEGAPAEGALETLLAELERNAADAQAELGRLAAS